MGMKESPTATATLPPLILRNLIASFLIHALDCFLFFVHKYQLLDTFRGTFLFFLRFLPSSFLHCVLVPPFFVTKSDRDKYDNTAPRNDTGIGRALSQLLYIVNDIPVSSRKYEVVRSLAERVMEENHEEGVDALRRVNREVLCSAFGRTLNRVEALVERGGGARESGGGMDEGRVKRVVRVVRDAVVGSRGGGEGGESGVTAEKLAAELVWLAQRMAACGCVDEAVGKWAAASNLGWLALSAEPRLQASLLKLAAFLFKEAKDMGQDETEGSKMEQQREVKLKMLQSWLPLLCRASNGTDAPVLSITERNDLEKVLEETIEELEQEEEQEQVLSLWLHHFTHSPSTDWPNLHACYARWCTASRKQLLSASIDGAELLSTAS